eukprot:678167-Pelagomonas_calceolata.AAC.7
MAFGPNVRMLANAQITSRNVAIMSTAGSPLHFWFGTATFQHLKQWMQAGDEELSSYDSWKPRGFGFVEFLDPRDAEDAMYALDRSLVGGREIQIPKGILTDTKSPVVKTPDC